MGTADANPFTFIYTEVAAEMFKANPNNLLFKIIYLILFHSKNRPFDIISFISCCFFKERKKMVLSFYI